MPTALTVTVNPSFDTTAIATRVEADRKIRCAHVTRCPGGGGINVARAIGILGGQATALWTMGGLFGTGLWQLLGSEGIDHVPIHIDGENRQSFAVIEEDGGRHYRFSTPGPEITREELDRLAAVVEARDYEILVLSGGLPPSVDPSFYPRLAGIASNRGARVVVDTHGEPLKAALDGGNVYLIKPNYRELAGAVGADPGADDFDVTEASRHLVEKGAVTAVVTSLGAAGVVMTTRDGVERLSAPTVPIRSKIGAGDSTVGGIVHALGRGDDLSTAVRHGVACGAAAVMTPGTELCRRVDVERLVAEIGAESDIPESRTSAPAPS